MTVTALDPRTALVVVDLQNAVRTLPYAHPIDDVIARAAELARAFRRHRLPVVLTVVAPRPSALRVDAPLTLDGPLPAGWDRIVDELAPSPDDHVVGKHHWGSFTGTDLQEVLRDRGVTQVVLAGVATAFGVESTARHAAELGFQVTLAVDAMSDMDLAAHDRGVTRIFPRLGECGTTDDILDRLASRPPAD